MASRQAAEESAKHAYERVPFYKKRGAFPSLEAAPLLVKSDLVTSLPKAWLPEGMDLRTSLAAGDIELLETPGTDGARARVVWKKGALREAENHVYGALTGEIVDTIALLGPPTRGMGSCHSGDPTYEDRTDGNRLHLNSRQDPFFWTDVVKGRMLEELVRQRTQVLVASPVYLAELASFARARGAQLAVSGSVVLGAALVALSHEQLVASVTHAAISEVYGMTETGPLLVRKGRSTDNAAWSPASSDVFLEYLPVAGKVRGGANVRIVVVTTTTREVMPLVRFATMDLVELDASGRVLAMHGRASDAILHPSGEWITSRMIERAFRAIHEQGDEHGALVQVTQRTDAALDVDVVRGDIDIAKRVAHELFDGMHLTVLQKNAAAIEPTGYFRLARRFTSANALVPERTAL